MTAGQRTVLRHLQAHAFNGPECRPSQDLLARETGLTREYVNRCVQGLAKAGHLELRKERRPGCKWTHNVYRLAVWSPPLRTRTLEQIRVAKRRGHTEGNPKRSRRVQPARCPQVPRRTTAVVARARVTLPIDSVRGRLDVGGWQPRGSDAKFVARCPVHDDRSASLSVTAGDDARVLLHCFAGCPLDDIVAALGLEMRDLFVPPLPGARRPPPKRSPRKRHGRLPDHVLPIDRVLARYAPNYRATASPNFWIAVCKVCNGELWIYAELDSGAIPSGAVTLRCENGCITNVRRRR